MKRALAFAPALAWALVILWLGSQPSLTPPLELPLDKIGHFVMFAVLGALLARGLHRARLRVRLALPLLAGVAIGAIDELHQLSVAGRSAEWADLAADIAGCVVGLWLTHRALQRRTTRGELAASAGTARPSDPIQEHRA